MSSDTFKNNKNLWKLNLSGNQIQNFPNGFFENIPDLQVKKGFQFDVDLQWKNNQTRSRSVVDHGVQPGLSRALSPWLGSREPWWRSSTTLKTKSNYIKCEHKNNFNFRFWMYRTIHWNIVVLVIRNSIFWRPNLGLILTNLIPPITL